MIKGPLIIVAAISVVKGYVFQPYGCADPSRQQSFPRSRSTRRQQVLRSVAWKRTALFYPGDEPTQISQPSFP